MCVTLSTQTRRTFYVFLGVCAMRPWCHHFPGASRTIYSCDLLTTESFGHIDFPVKIWFWTWRSNPLWSTFPAQNATYHTYLQMTSNTPTGDAQDSETIYPPVSLLALMSIHLHPLKTSYHPKGRQSSKEMQSSRKLEIKRKTELERDERKTEFELDRNCEMFSLLMNQTLSML